MQNCGHCNYQNPDGAKFCQQCGYPLIPPATSPLAQTAYPEPVPQTPTPKKGLTGIQKAVLVGSVLVIVLIIGVFASLSYSPNRTAPTPPVVRPPPPDMSIEVTTELCWSGVVRGGLTSSSVEGCGTSRVWDFPNVTSISATFYFHNEYLYNYPNYPYNYCSQPSLDSNTGQLICPGSLQVTAYHTDHSICNQASTSVSEGIAHVGCEE